MTTADERTSLLIGYQIGKIILGQRKAKVWEKIDITLLAASLDPLTAELTLGESPGGAEEFIVGTQGMPIRYLDGHLIVEDE